MKTLSFSILFLIIAFAGCKKEEVSDNQIVGNWRLVSVDIRSPSIISSKTLIPANKEVVISFTRNGEFDETYKNTLPREYAFLGCGGGSYDVEADNKLRIRASCMSSSMGRVFNIDRLSNKELQISDDFGSSYSFRN